MTPDSGGEVKYHVQSSETIAQPTPTSSPNSSFFQPLDIDALSRTIVTTDNSRAITDQVMPFVTNVLSLASAAQHGKLVLEILEPFVGDVTQHLDNAQRDLQARIPDVDVIFEKFVSICPFDLKELGWPTKPLEGQLVPALLERSPVAEITGFRTQLVTFRATVDKLHNGDLLGIAKDAIRGDLHLDEFKTQLAKLFDLLAIVQKGFEFLWALIKKIGDGVLQLFDKVKEYALKFSAAALAALQEFNRLTGLAAEQLAHALAAAEKFFADMVGKATEVLASTVASLKAGLETQLAKLKHALTASLAEVERIFLSAKQTAEATLKAAIEKVESLFKQSVGQAEQVADKVIAEARSLRDKVTSEPRKRLIEGRTKIEQLNRQIDSLAEKGKGSLLESVMQEGSAAVQREITELTETVCVPLERTIASADQQCEEVLTRAMESKKEAVAFAEAEKNRGLTTVQAEYDKTLQVVEKTKVDSITEATRSFEDASGTARTQFEGGTRDAESIHAKALAAAEAVKQTAKEEAEKAHAQTIAAAMAVKDEADAKAKGIISTVDTEMKKAETTVTECVKNPATTLSSLTDNMFVKVLAKLEAAKVEAEKSSSQQLMEAVTKGGCCGFLASCFRTPAAPAQPETQPLVNKT